MMQRKANTHQLSENHLETPTKEVTTGQSKLSMPKTIHLEYQQEEFLMLRMSSILKEVAWKRNKELPRCTSKLMETLLQANREQESMTGLPIQEWMETETLWCTLLAMESRNF